MRVDVEFTLPRTLLRVQHEGLATGLREDDTRLVFPGARAPPGEAGDLDSPTEPAGGAAGGSGGGGGGAGAGAGGSAADTTATAPAARPGTGGLTLAGMEGRWHNVALNDEQRQAVLHVLQASRQAADPLGRVSVSVFVFVFFVTPPASPHIYLHALGTCGGAVGVGCSASAGGGGGSETEVVATRKLLTVHLDECWSTGQGEARALRHLRPARDGEDGDAGRGRGPGYEAARPRAAHPRGRP